MADIIQLLPDSVANQIAAGEVVQRPASVIKELVENAVDAGADEIIVICKDAGRTLIQVIDNGMGMSDTDARLAFERHATSKIRSADDLFEIRTKGFRGEALASIAAIAHVVLRTRQSEEEIGTEIAINGSDLEHQISVSCAQGSNFMVKDLFYNVPARRKFLKSNSVELKNSIHEFQRIVLTHPDVAFTLIHNDTDIYRLPRTNLRQRIVHVFGKNINTNLHNLYTDTSLAKITGFIGKPELARKTSGEQFFFVNNRYMRHPYFHKAVMLAYEKIVQANSFPSYFIFLDTDPKTIDVNIHPTKTEIKFENEQAIFQVIQAAVKETLGKSSVMPSIDFDTEGVVDIPVLRRNTPFRVPEIEIDHNFNPFEERKPSTGTYHSRKENKVPEEWEKLYTSLTIPSREIEPTPHASLFNGTELTGPRNISSEYIQLRNKYIMTPVRSGLMVIDQKRAHTRILYEQFIQNFANNRHSSQMALYPAKLDLEPANYLQLLEITEELAALGLEIANLGGNTVVINSCPAGFENLDLPQLIEQLLEEYKQTQGKVGSSLTKTVALSLARAAAIDYGRSLQTSEMQQLVDELFACENPNHAPDGSKIITIMELSEFEKLLN